MPLQVADLRNPDARVKMATADLAVNFLLFTPLLVLHYQCTTVILTTVFLTWFPWLGALLLFAIGSTGQFLLTFYQRRIPGWIPVGFRKDRMFLLCVARLYTLLLVTLNICHITAVTFFFVEISGLQWVSTIKALTTATLVLWGLRAFRNTVCAPLYLSIDYDSDINTFHEFSTVFKTQASESQESLTDSLLTTVVVYSAIHLHWAAVTAVQDILFLPSIPFLSMLLSLGLGISACAVLIFFQHPACCLSKDLQKENDVKRIVFEDIFQFAASFAVITYWRGVTIGFDIFMGIFPLYWRGFDVTALVGWIMSYLMLILVHLTNSLPFKGCDLDGEATDGQGCLFSTAYFLDLLSDEEKKEEQESEKEGKDKKKSLEESAVSADSGVRQRHLVNGDKSEATPGVNQHNLPNGSSDPSPAAAAESDKSHLKQA